MSSSKTNLPKQIWMLWLQGEDNAPYLVRKCIASWRALNPTWDVRVLDEHSLRSTIELEMNDEKVQALSPALYSDFIRLALLGRYGGVWVDASTFCQAPLDDWLPDYCGEGVFFFDRPGPDRLVASWFMAATPHHPLIKAHLEKLTSYWVGNDLTLARNVYGRKRTIVKALGHWTDQSYRRTWIWFTPFVTRFLKAYPYYVFHYMFERLISGSRECREVYERMPKVSADGPHTLQFAGVFSPLSGEMKKLIDEKQAHLHKLNWRYDPADYTEDTLLYYLLEKSSGAVVVE